MGTTKSKCITENKTKVPRFIFAFFSIFSFFSLSLQGNKNGNFLSKISQELLDLGFWNLVQTSGMTGCTVYKRISHIWLTSPFICPFFFLFSFSFSPNKFPLKVLQPLMAYCRGYVSFAHSLLYLITVCKNKNIVNSPQSTQPCDLWCFIQSEL